MDAVTSPSLILDQPSGSFYVLINKNLHSDKDKLSNWEKFFSGEEVSYIFEDITCTVIDWDTHGLELAESYQSKLPENQMKINKEEGTLVTSKALYGKFDTLIMSKEIADVYGAEDVISISDYIKIEVSG